MEPSTAIEESSVPKWKPLSAIERRVLGVLIEKAKTTPENYPLSLNAIRVGSNQKSNRAPQMQLEEADVQDALDRLRDQGAVAQIQGDGRVEKYRHLAYDWLGVEKVELAVIGELLLRGDQTVGELRGRAARMDAIADLAALRPLLASLQDKGLIIYLTPQGRGCVITHALYQSQQMDKLRSQYGSASSSADATEVQPAANTAGSATKREPLTAVESSTNDDLRRQVANLQTEVDELRKDLARLAAIVQSDPQL